MSQFPVYTGQWIDWSHGRVLGSYLTLTVQDTLYIIAATGALLTLVGGGFWSIWAFAIHQYVSAKGDPDVISLQHRLIYRNDATATAAIGDAFWMYWTWKPWQCCGRKGRMRYLLPCHARKNKRAKHAGLHALRVIIPAFCIFAAFSIAGVFGSRIATHPYNTNDVLIKTNFTQGQCGIVLFDNTIDANVAFDIKAAEDTRAALSYARSCYPSNSTLINQAGCSVFTKRNLAYSPNVVGCPFGDPNQLFEDSMCAVNGNTGAFRLQTSPLDSHDDFGINAPPENRVQLTKELICSPLVLNGFNSSGTPHGAEAKSNTTITDYNYGLAPNVGNYTWQYNTASVSDNVPFEVFTLLHNATGPANWVPVSNLTRTDADVTIVFIAPNSITFREQVIDPVFQATYALTELSVTGEKYNVYMPAYQVSVIGCTERYTLCNPRRPSNQCTAPVGQNALFDLIQSLDLQPAQLVTAYRMLYMISNGNLYSSVNGIGPDALQIFEQVYNFIAPGVPQNQWQIEIRGWMDTTLAKWQAFMVEYAANTADPGPHGHVGFPLNDDTLFSEWKSQCYNQKISNLGAYQNVSVFGFAFAWSVSAVIIVISYALKSVVAKWRKRYGRSSRSTSRRIAWNLDSKFQQQRVALLSAEYRDLVGGEGDVPFLEEEATLPLPFGIGEEEVEGRQETNTVYVAAVKEHPQNGNGLPAPDSVPSSSRIALPDGRGDTESKSISSIENLPPQSDTPSLRRPSETDSRQERDSSKSRSHGAVSEAEVGDHGRRQEEGGETSLAERGERLSESAEAIEPTTARDKNSAL